MESLKLLLSSLTFFMCSILIRDIAAVTTCPITVATAAPIIPQRNTNMKIGSRIMFTTAPASVDAIAYNGEPSERITGFIACPNT